MSNADIRGRFVWHELLTTDTAAAAAFYPKVVPWRSQPSSMPGYTLWMAGDAQVGGLMALPPEAVGTPPHWLIYIGTPNVDATAARAAPRRPRGKAGGGHSQRRPLPRAGRSPGRDLRGVHARLRAAAARPRLAPASSPGMSSRPPTSRPRCASTASCSGGARARGTTWARWASTRCSSAAARKSAACDVQAGPPTPPSWLSYVQVADTGRVVSAAKASGGRLLHGPIEVPGGSWVALFMDPQGGAFAVHEMPRRGRRPPPAKPAAPPRKPAAAPKPAGGAARSRHRRRARAPASRRRPRRKRLRGRLQKRSPPGRKRRTESRAPQTGEKGKAARTAEREAQQGAAPSLTPVQPRRLGGGARTAHSPTP